MQPQRKSAWGAKTAWAKSFFDAIPATPRANGDKEPTKKDVKRMELDLRTQWKCKRCGLSVQPPADPTTGRPSLVVLSAHLEGTGGNVCSAGNVLFKDANDNVMNDTVGNLANEEELISRLGELFHDGEDRTTPRVFIVVENPKTPANMGSILRSMGCYGVDHGAIIYSGSRLRQALEHGHITTDTQHASKRIPQINVPSLDVLFRALDLERTVRKEGKGTSISVIAVDLIEGATPLPRFSHPFTSRNPNEEGTPLVFYLFGAEDGTLSSEHVDRCDAAVFIPTMGSLNLASTATVVLYDRVAKKMLDEPGADEFDAVFATRNANNRLTWKRRRSTS